MMDGTPRQTVSSRRGTSSHADEDDEDAAALGIEDDDDIDDAKYYTLRLSLQELPSCGIAYALAMAYGVSTVSGLRCLVKERWNIKFDALFWREERWNIKFDSLFWREDSHPYWWSQGMDEVV
jgi:hypothetical protein